MKNNTTKELQKIKDDLVAELDKRIADKIIEKTNADLLKKLIINAETINEAIMIAELGTTYKRTGFHFDKRLEKMTDTIKYFKKNEKLSFTQNKSALTHKLIIGDNYDALLNLLIEYRGKIDVIYIDPPYGKDSMGEFAKTNYENAITRDNLLSMLYPRLILSRLLLSDNGVIFCSIDDKNQAYVKGLFDEVFEEGNFQYSLSVVNNLNGNDNSSGMMETEEYCLIYARDASKFEMGVLSIEDEENDNWQKDELGYWKIGGSLKATGINAPREARPNLFFPIWINEKTLEWTIEKPKGVGFYQLIPLTDGKEMSWYWSKKKFEQDKNEVIIKKVGDGYSLYKKQRPALGDLPSKRGKTTFYSPKYATANSNAELKKIFGELKMFDYPKSVKLIKDLVSLGTTKDDAIVLDFFAGSGTTGQAVLELNEENKQKKRYILVQLDEDLDKAFKDNPKSESLKNQIKLCDELKRPHRLSEITAERLRRVMSKKSLRDNLDVYNIATITPYSDEPFKQIDETLYGKEKIGINEKIKWVCENFEVTQKKLENK